MKRLARPRVGQTTSCEGLRDGSLGQQRSRCLLLPREPAQRALLVLAMPKTPLHTAAQSGNLQQVANLLRDGAAVTCWDKAREEFLA